MRCPYQKKKRKSHSFPVYADTKQKIRTCQVLGPIQTGSTINGEGGLMDIHPERWGRGKTVKGREMGLVIVL